MHLFNKHFILFISVLLFLNSHSTLHAKKSLDLKFLNKNVVINDSISPKKETIKADDSISAIMKDYLNSVTSKVIVTAKGYIGTPYKFGGVSEYGIDCSALMKNIFEQVGVAFPRISSIQATQGTKIPKESLQKGDLVFFNTNRHGISHVGIVSETIDGVAKFIHASSSKGVTESSLGESYWASRYITARRIIDIIFPS